MFRKEKLVVIIVNGEFQEDDKQVKKALCKLQKINVKLKIIQE